MSQTSGPGPDEDDAEDEEPIPALPVDKPIVPDYYTPGHVKLVTVRLMGAMEAQLARAKLESEGIRCFVDHEAVNVVHPLVFPDVKLQVIEEDVERAREVLSRPAAADAEGEYAQEAWRCPKCGRKSVELLPLPPRWRRARVALVALIAMPLMVFPLEWAIPLDELHRALDAAAAWMAFPVVVVAAGLAIALLCVRREKRCKECGHQWAGNDEQEAKPG